MPFISEPYMTLEQAVREIKANTLKTFLIKPHSIIPDDVAAELGEALKTNTSLEVFSLSFIQLSDTAAQPIAQGLAHHSNLDKLILVGKKMNIESIYLFIDILPTLNKLTWLTLKQTVVADNGIKRIGQALQGCGAIKHLALEDNQITDEGARCFIECIKPIQQFIYIDLEKNNFSNTGLTIIKRAMQENPALMISSPYNKLMDLDYRRHVNSYAELNVKLKGSIRKAAAKVLRATRAMQDMSIDREILSLANLPAVIKKHILRFLDNENVLSSTQISNIYDYARDRSILKKQHEELDFLAQVHCDRPKQYAQRVSFFKPCNAAIETENQPSRPEKRKGDTGEAFLPLIVSPSKKANIAVI